MQSGSQCILGKIEGESLLQSGGLLYRNSSRSVRGEYCRPRINTIRVASIAASTTACLAQLKPETPVARLVPRRGSQSSFAHPNRRATEPETRTPAGVGKPRAGKALEGETSGGMVREPADSRTGQQINIVDHVKDAAARRLQIAISLGGLKRPQHQAQ